MILNLDLPKVAKEDEVKKVQKRMQGNVMQASQGASNSDKQQDIKDSGKDDAPPATRPPVIPKLNNKIRKNRNIPMIDFDEIEKKYKEG